MKSLHEIARLNGTQPEDITGGSFFLVNGVRIPLAELDARIRRAEDARIIARGKFTETDCIRAHGWGVLLLREYIRGCSTC